MGLFIIITIGFLFQYKHLNEFPSHIHAWAQSDRYALSLGFIDNGLNFFKPQTFVYNHQFPDNWKVPSATTITAVDFPIHDYLPALVMKILNNTSPLIFRLYILFYSFLGLFFLFKLSLALTNHYLKSGFVVVFAATSPVFVYYQGGFLPSIPSLANAIIGLYFYHCHFNNHKKRDFSIGILFLTLAALSRTTFVIPLVAVFATEFFRLLKKQTRLTPKLIPVSLSIAAILVYWLYNNHLRAQYGSIFLNQLMPPDSWAQSKEILKTVYHNWFFQYFTLLHYIVLIAVTGLAGYYVASLKKAFSLTTIYWTVLTVIYLVGCVMFAVLMLNQFPAHDYYFLDTFFLPIIMFVMLLLSFLPNKQPQTLKTISIISVSLVAIVLILQPLKTQAKRRATGYWDITGATIQNYQNASVFIDSLGIPQTAKILVIDAVAPNIPFIQMQRKGFAVMTTKKENIENALTWDFDYIVVQNDFFISEVYTPYPQILSQLNKIADNGKITVCTLTKNNNQTLLDFMGLTQKQPVFDDRITFENTPDSLWRNLNPTTAIAYQGESAGHLTPDMNFGITYKTLNCPELTQTSRTLLVSSGFLKDTVINCELVVSVNANGQNIYYKSYNLNSIISANNTWVEASQLFQLPKIESPNYELAVYIWNTGKSELYYDNFGLAIY